MKFYRIETSLTFELPEGLKQDDIVDELTTMLIQFVEDRGGFMGGGVKATEVDEDGKVLKRKGR